MRNNQFIRQWRLLVLLRRGPKTLKQLARALDCCERTIRRDLEALQAVPLPIVRQGSASDNERDKPWALAKSFPEWPRDEETPVRELYGHR